MSGIAIMLAGLLKLESTIPRLVEYFDSDSDWWNELIAESLWRMRSPETVKLYAKLYPSLAWHGRLFLREVFENPRLPEIEPILAKLLKKESAYDLRANLGVALSLLGTPTARAKARAVYREIADDPERFQIAEILYCQFTIEGIEDPDLDQWRERMEGFRNLPDDDDFSELFSDVPSDWDDITPVDIKIGRNELCPCGSGKKYKKCCLNR